MKGLHFEDLTSKCKDIMPRLYDGHYVPAIVDGKGNYIGAVFVHREGPGILTLDGKTATSGGGIRWKKKCKSQTDLDAVTEGLDLPVDMTKKSSGLKVKLGGAKTKIFGHNIPPESVDDEGVHTWSWETRDETWRAFADEVLPRVPGYVTAEDSGTTVKDAQCIKKYSPQTIVAGLTEDTDSCPTTAEGLMMALKAALRARDPADFPLDYYRYSVQGIGGAVASIFVDKLYYEEDVVDIVGSEVNPENLKKFRAAFDWVGIVPPDDIYKQDVDVFMPCAFGGVLNKRTIPQLRARVVLGCANCQLEEPEDGWRMYRRGIDYCPAYVVNAGGMAMVIASTLFGFELQTLLNRIGENVMFLYAESKKAKMPMSVIADRMVAEFAAEHMTLPVPR